MLVMPDEMKVAYQFALEYAKQLLTLSTGVLAITITFTKDIVKRVPKPAVLLLASVWICFFLSIINGVKHIGALTAGVEAVGAHSATTEADARRKLMADRLAAMGPAARLNEDQQDTAMLAGLQITPDAREYGSLQENFFLTGLLFALAYGFVAAWFARSGDSAGGTGPAPAGGAPRSAGEKGP